MSSRSSFFLTNDNEHCYRDVNDDSIVIEFNKKNIKVLSDNEDCISIEIIKGSEIYNELSSALLNIY